MNKERRQQLNEAIDNLEDAVSVIQDVYSDEEEAYENLNEGLRCGKTGDSMQASLSHLDDFISSIEGVKQEIEDFVKNKKKKR